MTLQQERAAQTSAATKGRPGPAAAFWLVWRQHGGLLVASAVTVLLLCVALAFTQSTLAWVHCSTTGFNPSAPLPPYSCGMVSLDHTQLYSWSLWLLRVVVFLPVAVGALWGAPLVSREYERGTHALAWGQSLSATQWLRRKVAVLALVIVVLGAPLWWFARPVAFSLSRVGVLSRFGWLGFATTSPLLVPYCLAALAVGVLISVLLRKTLPSVVLAIAVCSFLGVGTADQLRPHYEPAVVVHYPASQDQGIALSVNPLYLVDNGWADAAGHATSYFPAQCTGGTDPCLKAHGISGRVTVYQPAGREAGFQWIEAGLCVLLAAGSLLAATRLVRRRRSPAR